MNKGYAFGFLLVLLVVILGLYVAFTGFMASREALQAQATMPSDSGPARATRPPTNPPASPTPTEPVLPTTLPSITATLTAVGPLSPAEPTSPEPAEPTVEAPVEPPPVAPTEPPLPTDTAVVPTPVSAPAYQFRIAGPPEPDANYPNCCYILGTVRDAAGNGLEGVLVQAFNEWNSLPPSLTKGGAEAGQYDIPIGRDAVTWYVMIVDAGGTQVSTQVQIQFDPNRAGGYRVNWVRTY